MPRPTLEVEPLMFTSNTSWLEDIDARRAEGPEELLSRLEDLLDLGELTEDEVLHYLQDH